MARWGFYLLCGLGWVGFSAEAKPPLHTLVVTVSSNVAAGSALHIAGDRPELGSLTTTGAIRMFNSGANQWVARVAVQGSTSSTAVSNKFFARTTSSATHCTAGNGTLPAGSLATNLPLWNPGYAGKTIYYHSTWTNVKVHYRVGTSDTWADSPVMTRLGQGRNANEHRYVVTGVGEPGRPLEFVMRGMSNSVEVWDNPTAALGGIGDGPNYYTSLDFFFVQDKQIFNYQPPATVSAPQVISVANWASSYTGNGIPSRGGRVYLPRGYTQNTAKRYPVLYMHDGQNVFDPGGSFGSWSADAAATREIASGRMRETVIVAVNNTGSRMSEYGTPQDGYTGNYYLLYLVHNVKPTIDATYRTLTDFMNTGNMGSSLGGLISAYIGLSTNKFGLIGAVSPSYWYGPNFRSWINTQPTKGNRIYQDAGTTEGSSMWDYFWPVYTYYLQDGYVVNDDLLVAIGCGQGHNEAAWAARVAGAFRYLYNPWDEANGLDTNTPPSTGALRFDAAALSVSETGGSVRVYVSRSGGSNGAASVSVATSNGTAVAGSEYTATNATLSWADGDAADKYFDVTIADNGVYGGDKSFTTRLGVPSGASLGSPDVATITILDDEPAPPPPPELLVTNPPAPLVVDTGTDSFDVQGVANPSNWVGLVWTNNLTGEAGVAPIGSAWAIGGVALGVGTNTITVSATNVGTLGVGASDSATNAAYNAGWTNGSAGGAGWAAGWTLAFSTTNSGHFLSADTNDLNNSVGPRAWGMWANNSQAADAWRTLAAPLAVGQAFTLRLDNNWIQNNGSVGFGLQNAAGSNLFEFFFVGGATNYTINDSIENRNSLVPWTDVGPLVTFRLTNSTQYRFTCGTNVVTGTLKAAADQGIVRFHTWNFTAGAGLDYNYYFNDLAVTGGVGGAGASTSVTISIVRPGVLVHDGIPMTWWDRYGLGTNSTAAADGDSDGASNWEEYLADTDPGESASVYSNRILAAEGQGTMSVQTGPPTTNSRVYDVWRGADLLGGDWTPLHLDVPGADDGGPLFLVVTNAGDGAVYRTGVRLP